jgi:hypothetical protein
MDGIDKPESGRPVGVSGKDLGAFGAACRFIPRSLRGCFYRLLTPDAKVRSLEKLILGWFDASQSKAQFDVGELSPPSHPAPCYSQSTTKQGRSPRTRLPFGRSRDSPGHNVDAFVTVKVSAFQPSTCSSDSPRSSLTLVYSTLCPSAPGNMISAHNKHLTSMMIRTFRQKTNLPPTETCGLAFDTVTTWYGHSRRHSI